MSFYICIYGWAFKEFHWHFMVMCYVSGTFYLVFLFLARNPCVNVVSHKLSLKLFKSQSQYQCKFSLFYSCLDHSHATVVSLVELSKNFTHILWSCAIYSGLFHRFLVRNSCVNVVTQKLFLKLLQNSIKVPMCKLELYLCRENIDFLKIWNMSMKVQMSILKNLYNVFFSLHFWYNVDKTRQQHNQSLVNLRSYNHLHQP